MDSRENRKDRKVKVRSKSSLRRKRERRLVLMSIIAFLVVIIGIIIITIALKNSPEKDKVPNPEDPKVQLEWLISEVDKKELDDYTDVTVEVLEERYQDAKAILEDPKCTKTEMEEASINLLLAMQDLQKLK